MKNKKKFKNAVLSRMIFQLLTVFLFIGFTVVMGILFIFMPKKDYSVVENRYLLDFPKFTFSALSKGTFTDDITKFVSDNFAFREGFYSLGSKLEDSRGIRAGGVKIYNSSQNNTGEAQIKQETPAATPSLMGINKIKTQKPTAKPGETLPIHLSVDDIVKNADLYANLNEEDIQGEQRGALFVVKNTALEIFYGNSEVASDYCNMINSYKEAVGNNVKVYSLVVPTHFEFGLPKKYKGEIGREQKPFFDQISNELDSSVIFVDAYSNIKKHYNNGEYLYFNSDHHWTSLGAYRAYTEFAKKADFKATPLKAFEKRTIDKFLGTFYSSTFDVNLENNPDRVDYYVPSCSYDVLNYQKDGITTYKGSLIYENLSNISHGYLVFMSGDIPLSVINTNNNTGRSIIVFKESYGNPFIPFLVTNYDTVYVADIRTFPFNSIDFVKENNIGEVLFLNNIMTSCTPARIQNYINMMKK